MNCAISKITTSFFDRIAVADMERIHSAIIGWMFSEDCSALTPNQKLDVLNGLFGTKIVMSRPKFETVNEFSHIDIYIKLSDADRIDAAEYLFVIENKLKSSQQDNQLAKYESVINGDTVSKLYLTLIEEKPASDAWIPATYSDLLRLLHPYIDRTSSNIDSVILNEYYQTLTNLCNVVHEFIQHPESYNNVFSEGSLQKAVKLCGQNCSEISQYIRNNNLETILQKMYFSQILADIHKQTLNVLKSWVTETRGNAEIGFTLMELPFPKTDKSFELCFSFQNGSSKFSVALDYSNIVDSRKNIELLKAVWDEIFKSIKESKSYGYNRINNSRGRARISISKHKDGWSEMTRTQFYEYVYGELKTAINLAKECHQKYFEKSRNI